MTFPRNMKRYLALIVLAAIACLCLAGCATSLTRADLLRKLHEKPAPLVVDVRSQGEYDKDHIPGAVHIPFSSIGSGLKALGRARNDEIVLYCEHGPRAGLAGLTLYLSGYDRVYSLEGHMKGWRESGLPVEPAPR
jgi:rhodanese-related sulfurtransferase